MRRAARWLAFAAVAIMLLSGDARAEGFQDARRVRSTLLSVGWDVGLPLGPFREYLRDPAYAGIQVEARRGVARSVSVGLASSWTWFAETAPSMRLEYPDATVTGPVYRRVRFGTVRATGHWYLGGGPVQPYLGVGAGGLSWETYRMVGDSVERRSGWSPTVDPQLGVLWTVSRGAAVHFQARYQYSKASFSGVRDASWLGLQVGLAIY